MVRPADLVFLRNETLAWCRRSGWRLPNPPREAAVNGKSLSTAGLVIETLELAELFHVSSDMTRLAVKASETLPVIFEQGDLPAEQGLMVFESNAIAFTETNKPNRTLLLKGFAWHAHAKGVVVVSLREGVTTNRPDQLDDDEAPLAPYSTVIAKYGNKDERDPRSSDPEKVGYDPTQHVKILLAASLLMRQPGISVSRHYRFDKLDRARFKRRRTQQSPVRVIELRNPKGIHTGDGREYFHRWVVRGHWRRQACGPNRTERRLTWITPYIKGPEDAPLLTGEKVYSWVR